MPSSKSTRKHQEHIEECLLEIELGAVRLRVIFGTYKGKPRVDVREWFYNGEEWVATRRGMFIRPHHLDDVIDALNRGRDRLADIGELDRRLPEQTQPPRTARPALTDDDLRDMLDGGWTITDIAAEIGVSKSTISRRAKALRPVAWDVARNSLAQPDGTPVGASPEIEPRL